VKFQKKWNNRQLPNLSKPDSVGLGNPGGQNKIKNVIIHPLTPSRGKRER
jgi:hypothetical protein